MMPLIARQNRYILFAVAGLCLTTACNAQKAQAPDVWAVVDDHEIRQDDVLKAYRQTQQPQTPSDDEAMMLKLGVVDELITQEVLLGKARELKLDITDAEVETAFNTRKGAVADAAFQQALKDRSLTVDDLKQAMRRELLAQKVIDREVTAKVNVTDQEAADYFNSHRAQFNVPETQYHIAQIVVTPVREQQLRNRKNDDATTPAESDKKAQMLMERLKAGGDFATLAMDYSEDPQSAPQGGDLGFVSASALARVPAELRNAVLKAEPGTVNVVSSAGAHTLVLLAAREAAGQRDLGMPGVRDGITSQLKDRKEQLLRAAYITTARNNAKIVNLLARRIVEAQSKPPALPATAPGK